MRKNLLILKYLFKASRNRFNEKPPAKKLEFIFVSFLICSASLGLLVFLSFREYSLFKTYGEILFLVFIRAQLIVISTMAFLMQLLTILKPYTENVPLELASQLPLTIGDRLSFRILQFSYESKRFFILFFYISFLAFFITGKITITTSIVFVVVMIATCIFYASIVLIGRAFIKKISNTFFRQNLLVLTFFLGAIFSLIFFTRVLYSPFAFNLDKYLTLIYYWPTSWPLNIINSIAISSLVNYIRFSLILFSATGIVFTFLYFLEKRAYLIISEKYFAPLCKNRMVGSGILEKVLGMQRAALLKKEIFSFLRTPFFYMFFVILIAIFIFFGIILKDMGKNTGDFLNSAYLFYIYISIVVCIIAMSVEELLLFRFFNREVGLIKQLPISYRNYVFMKMLNSTFITIILSGIPILVSSIIGGFSVSQILDYMIIGILLSLIVNLLFISILIVDIPNDYMIRGFKKVALITVFLLSFFISKMFISYGKIYIIFFPLWIAVGFICLMHSIKKFSKLIVTV